MSTEVNVVVLGAGYAGVFAANRLAKKAPENVRITVINPRDTFVERVRLHQLAAGTHPATRPLADVLHGRVHVRVTQAQVIDQRSVQCADGQEVPFDYLLVAIGSHAAREIPGSEHALAVCEFSDALALQKRLTGLQPAARVNVIGGGLTAIETVSEIAEAHQELDVHLYSDGPIAAPYPQSSRAYIENTLQQLGVTVHTGECVRRIHPDTLETAATATSDLTVLAAGFRAPDLARRSGFTVDEQDRMRTDAYLRSIDNPRVFAIGDAGIPPSDVSGHFRMACATANPMGAHGANNVLKLVNGEEPDAFSLGYAGQCVSLGRKAGILQFTRRDDTPRAFALKRRSAAMVKEAINSGLTSGLKLAPAIWLRGPKMQEMMPV